MDVVLHDPDRTQDEFGDISEKSEQETPKKVPRPDEEGFGEIRHHNWWEKTLMATRASPNPRWWIGAIEGIVAILFGLSLLFWPHLTLRTLLSIVGAYVLVAGVLVVIGAMRAAEHNRLSSRQIVEGGVGVIVGALAFLAPGIAATILLYLIAVWAAIVGIPRVVNGLQARDWELSASGAVLIVLALVLLVYAGPAILTITWLIGLLVLVYGALTLMRGLRTRGLPSVS